MQEIFLLQHIFEKMSQKEKICDKEFIVEGSSSLTYSEFYDLSICLSSYILQKANVSKGDRILLVMDNCKEFYVSFLATILLGAIVVPVSKKSSLDKIISIVEDCEAKAALCASDFIYEKCNALGKEITIIDIRNSSISEKTDVCFINSIDADPVMIIYTSGSTGKSKGVVCSHLNVISALKSISCYLGLGV